VACVGDTVDPKVQVSMWESQVGLRLESACNREVGGSLLITLNIQSGL